MQKSGLMVQQVNVLEQWHKVIGIVNGVGDVGVGAVFVTGSGEFAVGDGSAGFGMVIGPHFDGFIKFHGDFVLNAGVYIEFAFRSFFMNQKTGTGHAVFQGDRHHRKLVGFNNGVDMVGLGSHKMKGVGKNGIALGDEHFNDAFEGGRSYDGKRFNSAEQGHGGDESGQAEVVIAMQVGNEHVGYALGAKSIA